jgi:DeoR/GlpR family transcriptional regulator of sugar metabolism
MESSGDVKQTLAEVPKSGSVSSGWLVKNMQVTYDTANRDLLALAELKILIRNDKGRASKYVLLKAKSHA